MRGDNSGGTFLWIILQAVTGVCYSFNFPFHGFNIIIYVKKIKLVDGEIIILLGNKKIRSGSILTNRCITLLSTSSIQRRINTKPKNSALSF